MNALTCWLDCLGLQLGKIHFKVTRLEAPHLSTFITWFPQNGVKALKIHPCRLRGLASFSVCLAAFSCMRTPSAELLETNSVCYPGAKQTGFVCLGFSVVFIVGREQDRAANTLLLGGDKPLYQGNCPSDRSLRQGMNPRSQAGRSRCRGGVQWVRTAGAKTYNSRPLTKRDKRVSVAWVC